MTSGISPRDFLTMLFISLLSSSIFIIPLLYWVYKKIVFPISQLRKGVHKVRRGNFDHDFSVSTGNDFDDLASNLNHMIKTIKQQQLKLEELSLTDHLTGLANRRRLETHLEFELERFKRKGTPLSLLVCDIDDFKIFNDLHGHLLGDTVLAEVGSLFKTNLRKTDVPSRFGGEEFVILLPETNLNDAKQVADKLREEVSKMTFSTTDNFLKISMTIGISSTDQIKNLVELKNPSNTLLDRADRAMYKGKGSGKNRISI